MPKEKNAPADAPKNKKRVRRNDGEIRRILDEIQTMVATGTPLMKALKAKRIQYTNHYNWKKRFGKAGPAAIGKTIVGAAKGLRGRGKRAVPGDDVQGTLKAMQRNRSERSKLATAVKRLDAEFDNLVAKLKGPSTI